jgi:phosphoglycolate phosphatase
MPMRTKIDRGGRRQAVIFDFDGTIADSFEYVFKFLKKEAGSFTEHTAEELEQFRRLPMKNLALRLGVPVWRLPVTYFKGRRVMRAHMEHVQPVDGMVEVIRQLHRDGYMLFITSANSGHNIRHLLRHQGILGCFRAIRSSAGITGKPALIGQLVVRYRLRKRMTWYVGDETGDVAAARHVGVLPLAVGWGFADPEKLRATQPEGYARKPAQIVQIVEKQWKR